MISDSKTFDKVGPFKALPRPRLTPGGVPNGWHFDLRYIQFEPPSHVLFMFQPESRFVHMETLPLQGQKLEFFPDTAAEAASEVAKAVIHSFVNNMGVNKMMGADAPPPFAPWRLMTECKSLAAEVGKEFKRMDIQRDLCKIDISAESVVKLAQEAFEGLFSNLKLSMGFKGVISDVIAPPTAIVFRPLQLVTDGDNQVEKILAYARALDNAKPPIDAKQKDYAAIITRVSTLLASKPFSVIKREAEGGHPEAVVDYALRLRHGIGCEPNRSLSRVYLVQALHSPSSLDGLKATAHALLIDWCLSGFKEALPLRYMFAACHHANEAIVLGRAAAAATAQKPKPKSSFAAPTVLSFLYDVFQHFGTYEKFLWYKHAVAEMDLRKAEIETEANMMNDKRLKHPNRYRCATVGCGIESNTGKILQSCGGKCDPDVKPYYCSKGCQTADWKNHKPFCKPGAPCSVLDPEYTMTTSAANTGAAGSIQIPVKGPDGKTIGIGSSTMDQKMLKEMRDLIEARSGGFPRDFHVDIHKV